MPDLHTESRTRTLFVAFLVCAVCSLVVSSTAVFLAPQQRANLEREREQKIVEIIQSQPGLTELLAGLTGVSLESHVVELATGEFADHLDATRFDARRSARDPLLGVDIPDDRDLAQIGRRSRHAVIYQVESAGRIELLVLPVHGSGYASTIYGYLAIARDMNTVAGLTFYEHGETPGLGAEIENREWLDSWRGKQIFDATGEVRLDIVPDEVDPTSSGAEYQVDGLTGATRTCDGVTALLRYWLGEDGFGPFLERVRRKNEDRG